MNKNNSIGNKGYVGAFTNAMNNTVQRARNVPTKHKFLGVAVFLITIILIIYFGWSISSDYRLRQGNEPWLIPTTRIARTGLQIPGQVIKESADSQYGIEFTYAFWIYVTDWTTFKSNSYKHIFHKGNNGAVPLQAPGVWLYPKENKMAINMNTFHSIKESCDIGNLPVGKWFHTTISVIGKNMDVYINGRLKKRCAFIGIPKQNFGDLYITQWGGFDGFLSKFRYFNYAVQFWQIEQMMADGPSKAPCTDSGTLPPYLSNDWWLTTGNVDAINFPTDGPSLELNPVNDQQS
jgi:hypothetical protein